MTKKTQNIVEMGTAIPKMIPNCSCLSANIAAALISNSTLSSLGSLHPFSFRAETRKEYRNLSLNPDIIQYVSKKNKYKYTTFLKAVKYN